MGRPILSEEDVPHRSRGLFSFLFFPRVWEVTHFYFRRGKPLVLGFHNLIVLHLRVSTLVLFIQFCFRVSFRSSLSSSCGFGSFSLSGGLVFRFGSSSCKSS